MVSGKVGLGGGWDYASLVGRAGSSAHSQEQYLRTNHGLSASLYLAEGWTVVERRKEKRSGKKRRAKKGKEQKRDFARSSIPVCVFVLHPCGQGKIFPLESSEFGGSLQFCGSRAFVEHGSAHAGSRHKRCPFSRTLSSAPGISKTSSRVRDSLKSDLQIAGVREECGAPASGN